MAENKVKVVIEPTIDDTNLSKTVQEKWKSFASEFDYELETKEFYVPFKIA